MSYRRSVRRFVQSIFEKILCSLGIFIDDKIKIDINIYMSLHLVKRIPVYRSFTVLVLSFSPEYGGLRYEGSKKR